MSNSYTSWLSKLWENAKNEQNKKLTGISLYAGCGGSSLGYKAAGIKISDMYEYDTNACSNYKKNMPETSIHQKDISDIDWETEAKRIGNINLLDASPPCQGFSIAKGKRTPEDERNDHYQNVIKAIYAFYPDVVVIENVDALTHKTHKNKLIEILNQLKNTGYSVTAAIMDASNYSTATTRKRLIIIMTRPDLKKISHPDATSTKKISVKEALKNIKPSTKHNLELTTTSATIYNFIDAGQKGSKIKTSNNFGIIKMRQIQPAQTIVCSNTYLHPTEKRYMATNELQLLQGFPQEYIFEGSYSAQKNRIGNSVCPPLTYAIGQKIVQELTNA